MSEHLFIYIFIAIAIISVIPIVTAFKITNIRSKLARPLSKSENMVLFEMKRVHEYDYHDLKQTHKSRIAEVLRKHEAECKQFLKTNATCPVEYRFKSFLCEDDLNKVVTHEANNESVNKLLSIINSHLSSLDQIEAQKKHDHYLNNDKAYKILIEEKDKWAEAKRLYDWVLKEVGEAISSVSDAQIYETIDLFSKNKGFSIASTLATSSASGEIDDIYPRLKEFTEYMKSLKTSVDYDKNIVELDDSLDLTLDIFFDFSFDFSSLMSLSTLSNSEKSLKQLRQTLEAVGVDINQQLNSISAQATNYLGKQL